MNQRLAAQLPASVRGSRSQFPKKSSFYFLHATVQGHSSLFLQKPLDMGLDGVENVMCKYWFGLVFSILISNWCFLFGGGGIGL